MPNQETPAERYRRLAQECLEVATTFPPGDQRDAGFTWPKSGSAWPTNARTLPPHYRRLSRLSSPPCSNNSKSSRRTKRISAKLLSFNARFGSAVKRAKG